MQKKASKMEEEEVEGIGRGRAKANGVRVCGVRCTGVRCTVYGCTVYSVRVCTVCTGQESPQLYTLQNKVFRLRGYQSLAPGSLASQ